MSVFYVAMVVIIMLVILSSDYYVRKQRKLVINKLVNLLINKNFAKFYDLLGSKRVQKLIPLFNLKLLEFNAAVLQQKQERAKKVFDSLQNKKMSGRQTIEFYGRALNYFIEKRDAVYAEACYTKINKVNGYQKDKNYLITLYKIMMLDETSDEEVIENRLVSDNNQEKVTDYYLLSHINEIKKNSKKAKKYNQLADKVITEIVE